MTLRFSALPGSRERQLQRQYNNPLFSEQQRNISLEQLTKVQNEELAQLQVFSKDFKGLFNSASKLSENVQSDVILKLKEDADRLYEQAASLPGDNKNAQESLLKLLSVIMKAVRHGAGSDAKAISEIEQETEARAMHMELMKVPLIVDMLNPDSLIDPENLAATILSADADELRAGLQLFELDQITQLYNDAESLMHECEQQGNDVSNMQPKLAIIADALRVA